MEFAADPPGAVEDGHPDVFTALPQVPGGGQARDPATDDHDMAPVPFHDS
ncbi:hypothetical protein GCM10018955_01030 [Planomonospora venezuelensis]